MYCRHTYHTHSDKRTKNKEEGQGKTRARQLRIDTVHKEGKEECPTATLLRTRRLRKDEFKQPGQG